VFEPNPSLAQIVPSPSPRVVAAVDRALAKNAAERFADMAAFVEALTGRPLMTMPGQQVAAGRPANVALDPTVAPAAAASLLTATGVAPAGAGTIAPPVVTKGRRGLWMFLAGVAIVAAAASALALRPQPSSDARPSDSHLPATMPDTVAKPVDAHEKTDSAADAGPAATTANPTSQAAEKLHEKTARAKTTSHEEPLPASVAAELDAAESALAAKDLGEAIRRARHSLYEKKTSRASAILTRAYCLQGDLGAAKAELGHVAAPERARVMKSCRAAGLEL
jgi:hypothetical protein